ncbi:hypothetical protein MNAN1_002196 [Malassezia nana]|uniref:chitin deacetylase n=1 Tax=Malassezia nana TaxID=180528 RepID=A0AAF0EMI0_9BASI|nr:hypothetical protein MNAN1_002196 [Malassezia nana]
MLSLDSCVLALLLAGTAAAHIGPGFVLAPEKRSVAHHRVRRLHPRDDTPTMSSWAKLKGANQECNDYSLPSSAKLQKIYPHGNNIATIVDGDDEAQSVWKEIQSSGIIPSHVQVKKGTSDHMGIKNDGYDADSDPDCWWSTSGCLKPKAKGISEDVSECPEPHTWGLTFDDGPNCGHNEFYDFLKDNKLKATMFYIGANVRDYPLQAQRGLADGHDICLHTWSHHYMTTLTNEQVFAELYYSLRIVKDVLGVTPRCWRPPFGDVDDRVRAIATGLGLRTIIWNRDTDDWNIQPDGSASMQKIDSNYQKIIDLASQGKVEDKGVVVLTHEIKRETMKEFMKMFPQIKKAYNNVVPLSACLNTTKPYVEQNITYPAFSDYIKGQQPQGLPDMDKYEIAVASKLEITKETEQKEPGGFSASSPQPSNSDDSSSSGSQGGSQGGDQSKDGNDQGNQGNEQNNQNDEQPRNASDRLSPPMVLVALVALVGTLLV